MSVTSKQIGSLRCIIRAVRPAVTIVCGPFKSGTSFLAEVVRDCGVLDISTWSNPTERGYATDGSRYFTHECKEVRRINDLVVPLEDLVDPRACISERLYGNKSSRAVTRAAEEFMGAWNDPILIKDPRFIYTLPMWVAAAERLHLSSHIVFTIRSVKSLRAAWEAAPITHSLLLADRLDEMCKLQANVMQSLQRPDIGLTKVRIGSCESRIIVSGNLREPYEE